MLHSGISSSSESQTLCVQRQKGMASFIAGLQLFNIPYFTDMTNLRRPLNVYLKAF